MDGGQAQGRAGTKERIIEHQIVIIIAVLRSDFGVSGGEEGLMAIHMCTIYGQYITKNVSYVTYLPYMGPYLSI